MKQYLIEELEILMEEYLSTASGCTDEYYMSEYDLLECGINGFIHWLKNKELKENKFCQTK